MKNLFATIIFIFFTSCLIAQSSQTEILDTAVFHKINQQVSAEALQFKKQLINNKVDHERITFCVDTFIIKHIEADRIKAGYSTVFVNKAISGAINAYSSLLQEYYNKLDSLLLAPDKVNLSTSKDAWLNFQKAEIDFIGTLTKDKYSGGGTIQTNIEAKLNEALVIERLEQVFNYYDTVFQNQ